MCRGPKTCITENIPTETKGSYSNRSAGQPVGGPQPAAFSSFNLVPISDAKISAVRTGPMTAVIGSWSIAPEKVPQATAFLKKHMGDSTIITGADYKKGDDTPLMYQMAAEAGQTNKVIAITHPKNLEPSTADARALPSNTWCLINSDRIDGWGGGTVEQPVGATVSTLDLLCTSSHPKVIVLGGGRVAAQELAIYHAHLGHLAEFEIVAMDIPRSHGGSCYGVLTAQELGYPVEPLIASECAPVLQSDFTARL